MGSIRRSLPSSQAMNSAVASSSSSETDLAAKTSIPTAGNQDAHALQRAAGQGMAARLMAKISDPHPYPWKPEQLFSISAGTDLANVWAKKHAIHRGIPQVNSFSFDAMGSDALARIDRHCRLTLHGDGSAWTFSMMSAYKLTQCLKAAGLREVGVLKIKSCDSGKGRFLKDVRDELKSAGIEVGYVSGLNDESSDLRWLEDGKLSSPLLYRNRVGNFTPEKFGINFVRGTLDVRFPGSRYDTPPALP